MFGLLQFVMYEFIYVPDDGLIIIQRLLLVSTPRIFMKNE